MAKAWQFAMPCASNGVVSLPSETRREPARPVSDLQFRISIFPFPFSCFEVQNIGEHD